MSDDLTPEQQMVKRVPFADYLGIEILSAEPDKLVCQLRVRKEITTPGDSIHGGAAMSLADFAGACAAYLDLPEGAKGSTTSESKTNFIATALIGSMLTATATPIHRGRRTSVWQTRIERDDGKLVALVTQTQMVLY